MTTTEETVIDAEAYASGRNPEAPTLYDRAHLWMISLMHDGIYRLLVDPHDLLMAGGLAPGLTALEVGCGPGFFTFAAAKVLGEGGRLYSLDINPAAVEHLRREVLKRGLRNVDVFCADAAKTGLPDASVDVAFLFGVLRSLRDLDSVLAEAYRVLKPDGVLAVQKSSWSDSHLLARFTGTGIYEHLRSEGRIYLFKPSRSSTLKPRSAGPPTKDRPREDIRFPGFALKP